MPILANQTILATEALSLLQVFSVNNIGNSVSSNIQPQGFFSDDLTIILGNGHNLYVNAYGTDLQMRDVTADYGAMDEIRSVIVSGLYVYAFLYDNGAPAVKLYRYLKSNIGAGGTLMTISGQAFGTTGLGTCKMTCNPTGTTFYFTYKAGNSASGHVVSKYTLSGTTLTYVSDVTCGSTSANFDNICKVDSSGNIYGMNNSDAKFRKYNSSGTLQTTSVGYASGAVCAVLGQSYVGDGVLFLCMSSAPNYYNRVEIA